MNTSEMIRVEFFVPSLIRIGDAKKYLSEVIDDYKRDTGVNFYAKLTRLIDDDEHFICFVIETDEPTPVFCLGVSVGSLIGEFNATYTSLN